ncbi:MAG: 3-isopropylmalate dehydratase [Gammaproteobacteria bacterium]|jgi:3-isopropylmalate dehydratase small subunit|nr:3-isopropylmalate dehydratase [Chromatiales bacterium]MDP7093418.1 3-isopropylmalate dehydratase [Gammaproteobacteria bacterium]MDP7270071.1 3-isopropylmalate dehydratase [Gammaproteobacteria bacterium]MDP7418600.1 3-isopropylmalate dehydratase [Gammaproteobacteria bacterium]MDP7661448.1 3-isopropylmalate dehydratase [Gammaproteobacteria bacterium]
MTGVNGNVWVFGDEINTDTMAPGLYFKEPIEVMATHCLEAVNPDFAPNVKSGDIIVAGTNFGMGSAREQAPMALAHLGVGAILAKSFSRIFYRNAINFGLAALIFPQADEIGIGDELVVDSAAGQVKNLSSGVHYEVEAIPAHLVEMIDAGGLMPWLKKTYGKKEQGKGQ